MNKTKFTPGPWGFQVIANNKTGGYLGDNKPKFDIEIWANNGKHIATKTIVVGKEDEFKANAHLIAAAPEIYKALDDLTKWVQSLNDWAGGTQLDPPIEAAKAALLKAEGGVK